MVKIVVKTCGEESEVLDGCFLRLLSGHPQMLYFEKTV